MSIFTKEYWKTAASELKKPKMLAFAAVMIALRVAIRSVHIPVGDNLNIYFTFFVNALGAMTFGPVVAALGALVSDTIGALLFPVGAYFFPWALVEIAGSFIFALFLYKQKLTSIRVILSRFFVIFTCNIILTPAVNLLQFAWFNNWQYKPGYIFFSLPRIIKNLALFPFESLLLIVFLNALLPALRKLNYTTSGEKMKITVKNLVFLLVLLVLSIVAVYFYYTLYLAK